MRSTVVKCLVQNVWNEWLMGRRLADDTFGDLWEFPGGGVETSETSVEAAGREVCEELGVDFQTLSVLPSIQIPTSTGPLAVSCVVGCLRDRHQLIAHSELRFVPLRDAGGLELAPVDAHLVRLMSRHLL